MGKDLTRVDNFFTLFPALQQNIKSAKTSFQKLTGIYYNEKLNFLLDLHFDRFVFFEIGYGNGRDLLTMKNLFPEARIFGFDPNPEHLLKFQENMDLNSNINVFNVALWKGSGTSYFYVPKKNNWKFNELGSFKQHIDYTEHNFFRAEQMQLDDFQLLSPSFIKISTPFNNVSILHGGQQLLEYSRPYLMTKSPSWSTRQYLFVKDYHPYHYKHGKIKEGYEKHNPNNNIIFIPSEKRDFCF